MRALGSILLRLWEAERRMALVGMALTVIVLLAGTALLGLSGWFITAAAAAGLAGTGAVFDVFRPSASVRFLALGRAAARYGERLWTHEATLRAVSWLRIAVLRGHLGLSLARAQRLRASDALNRLTADMDLLDLLPLRVVFPAIGGIAALALTGIGVALLTTPLIGGGLILIYGTGLAFAAALSLRSGSVHARQADIEAQLLRGQLAEFLRQRDDLAVQGRLTDSLDRIGARDARARKALTRAQGCDRRAAQVVSLTGTLAVVFALGAGLPDLSGGPIDVAHMAIGVFAALALGEMAMPFQRAFADLGRMTAAAERVVPLLEPPAPPPARPRQPSGATRPAHAPVSLTFDAVGFCHPGSAHPVLSGFSARVNPGAVVAIAGPSGSGKSTLLALGARLIRPDHGQIRLGNRPLDEFGRAELRRLVGMLPQRSELFSGTVLDNLSLALPNLDADAAWAALDAARIGSLLRGRDGLMTPIGESGRGLSGGERRRIALSRVLLRKPRVLLLDEPTEGLNREMAESVLTGIRELLPETAILTASHRAAELSWADHIITFE